MSDLFFIFSLFLWFIIIFLFFALIFLILLYVLFFELLFIIEFPEFTGCFLIKVYILLLFPSLFE